MITGLLAPEANKSCAPSPCPKGTLTDSGDQFGINLSVPCYAFVNSADLSITKSIRYCFMTANVSQNQALINFGSTHP